MYRCIEIKVNRDDLGGGSHVTDDGTFMLIDDPEIKNKKNKTFSKMC